MAPIETKYYDKKLIFGSSPAFEKAGDIEDARRFCSYVLNCGAVPFAPQLFFPQFNNTCEGGDRS